MLTYLETLPNIQNEIDADASLPASTCTAFTSAWNRNSRATPVSTIVVLLEDRLIATPYIIMHAAMAHTKAHTIVAYPPRNSEPQPNPITRDAPKAADIDIPRVYGSARGLFRMVCISAPAMPRATPVRSAKQLSGTR